MSAAWYFAGLAIGVTGALAFFRARFHMAMARLYRDLAKEVAPVESGIAFTEEQRGYRAGFLAAHIWLRPRLHQFVDEAIWP